MIFFVVSKENIVQVDDTTMIDASRSRTVDANITLVEIDPDSTGTYYDVTTDGKLLWQYAANGEKTIKVKITTDLPETTEKTYTISVLNETDDRLFSSDTDLIQHEDDILGYLREGRTSYLDKHRTAQEMILDALNTKRIEINGDKLKAVNIADLEEVKKWSKFLTLSIIFGGLSNQVDDIFSLKQDRYAELAEKAAGRAQLRIDKDGDSNTTSDVSNLDMLSTLLVRR